MQDMTQGPIRAHLVRMLLFMLSGMLLQTLYSLIDIYWVGRLGSAAVAAVSVASNLMFVVIAISQALGVGCVALVSQAFGRKDLPEVQRVFNQSQCMSLVTGVLFLVVGYATAGAYAESLGSDPATSALIGEFLGWFVPAMALQFTMVGLGSALRGIGNMKPGLFMQMGSVLLNMVLAPFLIFGWGTGHPLGVAGAALATFIATLVAVLGLVVYLARSATFLRVDVGTWRPDWKLWGRLLVIGLPSGGEFIVMSVVLGLIYFVIRPFGPEAQGGFGIGLRIMQAGFMPAVCLSFAAAAVAGQNYGARQLGRVRETFIEGAKLNIGFMVVFIALCQLVPEAMMRLFSHEAHVVDVGAGYLRMVSLNYVASALILVAAGVFQGIGHTLPSLGASASRLVTFVVPVLWLATLPGFTLHQVWVTSVVSVNLQMVLALALLWREARVKLVAAGSLPGVAEALKTSA